MDARQQEIVDHIAMMVTLRKSMSLPSGFLYAGMEDLLQQHGQFWAAGKLPRGVRYGVPKHCFQNAQDLVDKHPTKYRYVEGLALGVIPVHHAWCVTPDGTVVDPTWRDGATSTYFGVEIPRETFHAHRTEDNLTVLDGWDKGWKILREPFRAEVAA